MEPQPKGYTNRVHHKDSGSCLPQTKSYSLFQEPSRGVIKPTVFLNKKGYTHNQTAIKKTRSTHQPGTLLVFNCGDLQDLPLLADMT